MSNERKFYETEENEKTRKYLADQDAKDAAFKLVPKAASTGHKKACEVYSYIIGLTEKEPPFYSRKKQQELVAAKFAYMQATV